MNIKKIIKSSNNFYTIYKMCSIEKLYAYKTTIIIDYLEYFGHN